MRSLDPQKSTYKIRIQARNVMKNLFDTDQKVKLTVYNLMELYKGAYLSKNVASSLHAVEKYLENFQIVHTSLNSAREYARLSAELRVKGMVIGEFDLLIGCIVIVDDDVLYTKNIKHFAKIPSLKYLNWEDEKFT
jgi:tRNA(fMet)-specific endonuclease VapC